ncbi:hypothetical protein JL722_6762 [Aureococcus anophagefferens]|nr:hypothetical protein JL722_6762 [Aureococcus anophagefferens]
MAPKEPPADADALVARLQAAVAPPEDDPAFPIDDACCRRYLRARDWDLAKATKMLEETLECATGKTYVSPGVDRAGRTTVIMRSRHENTHDHDGNVANLVYHLERAVKKTTAGPEEKWNLMIDFEGYSLRNAPPMKTSKATLKAVQDYYPERLHKAYLVDAPWIFNAFFKLISPFIDPVTKAKIVFVKGTPEQREGPRGDRPAEGFDGESIAEKEDVFVFGGAGALDYERVDGAAKFSYAVVQTETWGGYAVYMYNPNTVDVPRQPINCASATSLSFRYKWSIDGFGDVGSEEAGVVWVDDVACDGGPELAGDAFAAPFGSAARRGWTPRADSNATVGTDGLVISARDVGANGDAEATFALPPPAFYRFDAAETGFDGESIAEKEDVFVFGGAGALDYERVDGAAKFSYAVVQTGLGGYAVYMYNPNTVDVPRQPINCASATSLSFRYKVEAPSAGRVQLRLILMDCGDDACLEDPTLEEHWYSFFDVLGDDSGEWRTASIAPDTLTYTGWSGSADGNRIFDASTIMRWDLQWSIDGFGDVGSEEAGVVWVDDVACEATFALPPPAFYRLDAVTAISFLATATAAGAGVSLAVDGAVAVEADVGAAATEVSGSWSGGEITGYTVAATRLGTDGAAAPSPTSPSPRGAAPPPGRRRRAPLRGGGRDRLHAHPLTKSFHASTCCDVCAEEPGCRFFQSDGDHCYTAPALSGADAVFFRTGAVDDRLRTFRMDGGNELCDACACGASVDCAGRGLRLATAPALAVALTGDADLPDKLINVATRRSRFTNACCSRKATNMTVNGDEAFLCRVGERVSPYQGSRAEVWPDLFDDGAAPADTATGADALYTPNVNYVDGLDAKWILKKITPDTPFLGAAATSAAACAEWCHLIRDCDYFTHDARNDGVCWTFGDVAASAAARPTPPGPDFGPLDGVFDVSYAVEACDAAFDGEDVDVEVDFGGLAFGCGAGTEEAADGACRDCGAGFFSNALTRCEPCPPGTHAKASGASACVACDGTSYQPDWGKAACVQCPANTERPDDTDGSSINDCACKPGACNFATCATAAPFPPCDPVRQAADGVSTEVWDCADPTPGTGAYVTTRETGVACLECPKGGICLGGTALPFPEKGFGGVKYPADAETEEPYVPGSWRDDVEFKRCREHGRCKRNFECARGFDDLLCTDVDTREDYFGIGGFPVRCGFRKGASRSRKIAASIAAIVGVGVVWFWINFGIQAYSALNIFFANLRVFFVVSKMNVEWPPVLIGWYAFFQMSQFDVDLICLVAVLCLFYFGVAALKGGDAGPADRPSLSSPAGRPRRGLATATTPRRAASLRERRAQGRFMNRVFLKANYAEAIAASINVGIICYPALLDNSLSALLCEQFSDGHRYVRSAPDFKCDTKKWYALVVLAALVIPALVAFPVGLALLLWRKRDELGGAACLARYGGLYQDFRAECLWWTPLLVGEVMIITMAKIATTGQPVVQTWLMLLLTVAQTAFHLTWRPYLHDRLNHLAGVMLYTQVLFVSLAPVFSSDRFEDDPGFAGLLQALFAGCMAFTGSIIFVDAREVGAARLAELALRPLFKLACARSPSTRGRPSYDAAPSVGRRLLRAISTTFGSGDAAKRRARRRGRRRPVAADAGPSMRDALRKTISSRLGLAASDDGEAPHTLRGAPLLAWTRRATRGDVERVADVLAAMRAVDVVIAPAVADDNVAAHYSSDAEGRFWRRFVAALPNYYEWLAVAADDDVATLRDALGALIAHGGAGRDPQATTAPAPALLFALRGDSHLDDEA